MRSRVFVPIIFGTWLQRTLRTPTGTLAGLTICTQDDEKLGAIGGVLLEPASRRVRYFVVEEPVAIMSRRRYLLAADTQAVLDATVSKLRVEANAGDLERFDSRLVRTISDGRSRDRHVRDSRSLVTAPLFD